MHERANTSPAKANAKANAVAGTQNDSGCRMHVQPALSHSEATKIEYATTPPSKFLLTFV
jgi:hypothetical protein